MFVGGLILDHFRPTSIFTGFAILFVISWLFRSTGGIMFTRKYEPRLVHEPGYYFSIWQFLRKMFTNNFGRFAAFEAAMSFAVAIGSPFIAVYMLQDLQFSYTMYILVTMGGALSTLIFMPFWGKFADRFGNLVTIRITSFLIPLIVLCWTLSPLVKNAAPGLLLPFLILTDALSGIAWSGFNLCTSNFIYDAVTRQRLSLCVAYSNIINGFGTFVGAALGGLLASHATLTAGLAPLILVFAISTGARLAVAIAGQWGIKEVRPVQPFDARLAREKLLRLSPGMLLRYFDLMK